MGVLGVLDRIVGLGVSQIAQGEAAAIAAIERARRAKNPDILAAAIAELDPAQVEYTAGFAQVLARAALDLPPN